jgi:hypothetical protein
MEAGGAGRSSHQSGWRDLTFYRMDEAMAPVFREPLGPTDPPAPICVRCSKPITPGTASQIQGRPVHLRCLVRDTQLEAVEQQDRAGYEVRRARAAKARATELIDKVRLSQATCPACGQSLATSRGVLFQGDVLVHAACWRADPKPSPPAAE